MPWPLDALVSVSARSLASLSLQCEDITRQHLAEAMAGMHRAVGAACEEYQARHRRWVYVTPRSFLSFLDTFKGLYAARLERAVSMKEQVDAGLAKMAEAKLDVQRMKVGDVA